MYAEDLHRRCCSCSSKAYFISTAKSDHMVAAESCKKILVFSIYMQRYIWTLKECKQLLISQNKKYLKSILPYQNSTNKSNQTPIETQEQNTKFKEKYLSNVKLLRELIKDWSVTVPVLFYHRYYESYELMPEVYGVQLWSVVRRVTFRFIGVHLYKHK